MLGRDLEALVQRAREFKKEYGDSFVSVEHLVLGFVQDQRFGKQLFKDFQISLQTLKSAIESIRGRQSVIDQGDTSYFFKTSFEYFYVVVLCTCRISWLFVGPDVSHNNMLEGNFRKIG